MMGICWIETRRTPEEVFGFIEPGWNDRSLPVQRRPASGSGDYPAGDRERRRDGPDRNDR
jgi:hypothetical protein